MRQQFLLISILFGAALNAEVKIESLVQYVPENPIILECGAHNGSDTRRMSKLWPKGFIYAIEASPSTYRLLEKRTADLHNVMTFPLALGWGNTKIKFYVSNWAHYPEKGQCSLLAPNYDVWCWPDLNEVEIDVQMLTLDTWAEMNNITKIDFMWLDMQGADFNMLMAGSKILDTTSVIKIEISRVELYKDSVLFEEGKRYLEERGFYCVCADKCRHGDGLFVRKHK